MAVFLGARRRLVAKGELGGTLQLEEEWRELMHRSIRRRHARGGFHHEGGGGGASMHFGKGSPAVGEWTMGFGWYENDVTCT
jgi:hypothetical protein